MHIVTGVSTQIQITEHRREHPAWTMSLSLWISCSREGAMVTTEQAGADGPGRGNAVKEGYAAEEEGEHRRPRAGRRVTQVVGEGLGAR